MYVNKEALFHFKAHQVNMKREHCTKIPMDKASKRSYKLDRLKCAHPSYQIVCWCDLTKQHIVAISVALASKKSSESRTLATSCFRKNIKTTYNTNRNSQLLHDHCCMYFLFFCFFCSK